MEALSRGARQAGAARVVGVTLDLLTPPLAPNRRLTEEQRVTDFFLGWRRCPAPVLSWCCAAESVRSPRPR